MFFKKNVKYWKYTTWSCSENSKSDEFFPKTDSLRWSISRKKLTVFSRYLFSQNVSSQMFGKVLNTPLIVLVSSNDANFQKKKKQWQQISYVVIIVRKGRTKNTGVKEITVDLKNMSTLINSFMMDVPVI